MAVEISGLKRGFGKVEVLKGLDMSVDSGSIYGLLGPSGCGKTTLLKVMLGFLIPEDGTVKVPKGIPGSTVGYAPQELALYLDLTISETLLFHGRLHEMSIDDIKDKKSWLMNFLDLPDETRQIGKLSGGEKRRVSLAIALLHNPSLLLLDEPTVGVDPELRARIWGHMKEITSQGTTIIITTHYIDEAGKADRVGLMRNGKLLAEDSPSALMSKHDTKSLEEVFLKLCRREVKVAE